MEKHLLALLRKLGYSIAYQRVLGGVRYDYVEEAWDLPMSEIKARAGHIEEALYQEHLAEISSPRIRP